MERIVMGVVVGISNGIIWIKKKALYFREAFKLLLRNFT